MTQEVIAAIAARKAIYQAKLDQAMEASSLGDGYTREDLFRHAVEALEHLETDIARLPTDLSEERAIETLRSTARADGWVEINVESECWQTALRAMQQYAAGLQGEVEALTETCAANAVTIRGLVALARIKFGNLDPDANMIFDAALKQAEALSALGDTQ